MQRAHVVIMSAVTACGCATSPQRTTSSSTGLAGAIADSSELAASRAAATSSTATSSVADPIAPDADPEDAESPGISNALARVSQSTGATPADGATDYDARTDAAWLRAEIARVIGDFGDADRGQAAVPEGLVREVRGCLKWLVGAGAGRDWLSRSLKRMDQYGATVRAVFGERHLPPLLDYVALIESGYHARAHSRAGAAGMWQFMPATGRRYGLQVDRKVDERMDPIKATLAARGYLLDLLLEFGSGHDALLAIAAYNAGEGRIRGVLRRLEDYRVRSFWALAERGLLPSETKTYVPMILAASIAATHRARFGLAEADFKRAVAFDRAISKPEPRRRSERPEATAAKKQAASRATPLKYSVQRGNTVTSIAAALGVAPGVIERAAGRRRRGLRAGQVIALPLSGWVRTQHRVAKGDSLERIARHNGTSVRALSVFNGLSTTRIVAGELLAIYRRTAPALAVRKGERKS